jgi:hypothetical protein
MTLKIYRLFTKLAFKLFYNQSLLIYFHSSMRSNESMDNA